MSLGLLPGFAVALSEEALLVFVDLAHQTVNIAGGRAVRMGLGKLAGRLLPALFAGLDEAAGKVDVLADEVGEAEEILVVGIRAGRGHRRHPTG